MSEKTYAGVTVSIDAEGFMTDLSQWNRTIAQAISDEVGVGPLEDGHWQVIDFMREMQEKNGCVPSVRALGKQSSVSIKELYQLFPKGPAKLAAKIAGCPKPRGCI